MGCSRVPRDAAAGDLPARLPRDHDELDVKKKRNKKIKSETREREGDFDKKNVYTKTDWIFAEFSHHLKKMEQISLC